MTAGFDKKFIEWLPQVDSTNVEMKRRVLDGAQLADGSVLATLNQTAGRGRMGHSWTTGGGKDLAFSLFIAGDPDPAATPSLGMACALAVDDLLRELGINSRPKWPNDVRVFGKKICGILSERIAGRGVIAGIGINIMMSESEADAVGQPATSILIETGVERDPQAVLCALLQYLSVRCGIWRTSGFEGLRADWCVRVEGLGEEVVVHDGGRSISGVLDDFGPQGECILRMPDGRLQAVWSGDVTTAEWR